MLNQYSNESFKRAKQCPMNHNNPMLCIIRPDIICIKPFRQLEIKLNCCKLPASSQGILDMEVDFGPVESAFPCLDFIFYALAPKRFLKRFLCCVPVFNFSHEFFRPCAELNLVIKVKNFLVDKIREIKNPENLVFYHFMRHKNMRVILRHFSHSC